MPGSFTPPTIETERLRLLPFRADETDVLHQLFTDPGVRRYLLDDEVVSRDWVAAEIARSRANFRRRGCGLWTLRLHEAPGKVIGFCGYRHFFEPPQLQLLYGLLPRYWGQGLATEAACAGVTTQRARLSTFGVKVGNCVAESRGARPKRMSVRLPAPAAFPPALRTLPIRI